ncbi:MAG: glycosyltransferase [Planctomycetota bacterium]|nr:glycosyltransferase [Planctomycetota bacterium]
MKIIAAHNYYQQRGGEDQCFEDQVRVLRANGHDVREHVVHNDSIDHASKLKVAVNTLWSRTAYRSFQQAIDDFQPDVVHAINTFPLLSPSIFYAAMKRGVPVVHEVANYRLACAGTYLLRDGKICEKCVGAILPLAAIKHRCYRESLSGSAVVASSIALHRLLKTWHRVVDGFMCPSEVTKQKLIEMGLPGEKIYVKPNALDNDPGIGEGPAEFAVFVGRLSPEKGLSTVLRAWKDNPDLPKLKVIGNGPLAESIRNAARSDERIEWLGRLPLSELLDVVGRANCLLMPSIWYESFGRTTVEAFAKGTPVVGSRIGGTAEIIDEGRTGWLFQPGDADEFTAKIKMAMNLSQEEAGRFRQATRQEYLTKYTSQSNYSRLIEVYELAIGNSKKSRQH